MKALIFLFYFIVLNVFSSNDIEIYNSILKDIKTSQAFVDYITGIDNCGNVKVSGYLYSMCFLGSPFVFDNPDISDYLNEECFGEEIDKTKEFPNLVNLSNTKTSCLKIYFSKPLNNKIAVEVLSNNQNINRKLSFLYNVLADKTILRLEEIVLIKG